MRLLLVGFFGLGWGVVVGCSYFLSVSGVGCFCFGAVCIAERHVLSINTRTHAPTHSHKHAPPSHIPFFTNQPTNRAQYEAFLERFMESVKKEAYFDDDSGAVPTPDAVVQRCVGCGHPSFVWCELLMLKLRDHAEPILGRGVFPTATLFGPPYEPPSALFPFFQWLSSLSLSLSDSYHTLAKLKRENLNGGEAAGRDEHADLVQEWSRRQAQVEAQRSQLMRFVTIWCRGGGSVAGSDTHLKFNRRTYA